MTQVPQPNVFAALMDDGSVTKIERIANWMATCKVAVPQHLRGSLSDCIAVTVEAMERRVNPFALARTTSFDAGVLTYAAADALVIDLSAVDPERLRRALHCASVVPTVEPAQALPLTADEAMTGPVTANLGQPPAPAPAVVVHSDLVHHEWTPPAPSPAVAVHCAPVEPPLFAQLTITEPIEPASEPADLKLGVICERLGFNLTVAFVSDVLGIQYTATDKAAKLYRQSDFGRICAALTQHIHSVYLQQQHAAE